MQGMLCACLSAEPVCLSPRQAKATENYYMWQVVQAVAVGLLSWVCHGSPACTLPAHSVPTNCTQPRMRKKTRRACKQPLCHMASVHHMCLQTLHRVPTSKAPCHIPQLECCTDRETSGCRGNPPARINELAATATDNLQRIIQRT